MKDRSRERSLYFLLMATARPLVLSSNDVQAAREILNNLTIAENPSSWQVASSFEGKEISTEVPKDQFSFYATKRDTFYEVAPAVKNRSSALKVLNELFLKTNIDLGLSPKIERKRIASVPIPFISLALLFSSSVLNYVFNSKSLLSSLPAALAIVLSSRIFVLGMKVRMVVSAFIFLASLLAMNFSTTDLSKNGSTLFIGWLLFLESMNYWNYPRKVIFRTWCGTCIGILFSFGIAEIKSENHSWAWALLMLSSVFFTHFLEEKGQDSVRLFAVVISTLIFIVALVGLMYYSPIMVVRIPFVLLVSISLSLQGYRSSASRVFGGFALMAL